ncbi:MAG: hypothetical protein MSIBF_04170 [Candidatus Altiarchaeales archaeon IMC4]|nr:MAG: hypothetical protein MSIBF_04170 [Candidatus Altiarchaeales archaeon IMC4]
MVDTWAWLEILKGTELGRKARDALSGCSLYTTCGNTYELRYILKREHGDKADEIILGIIGNCKVVDLTEVIAKKASEIKLMKGHGIGAIDCFTLAAADVLGAKVLTGDPHMKDAKGIIYL